MFSKTSSRCLEDVFSVTLFVFQDLLKTSSRRLQDVFAIRLPKTSSRRLQDVFLKRLQEVFKTSSKRLPRRLQDVFVRRLAIMSSRRLQDVFARRLAIMSSRRLQDVFITFWKAKKCYTEDVLKTSSRLLQYVFTKTNVCWDITCCFCLFVFCFLFFYFFFIIGTHCLGMLRNGVTLTDAYILRLVSLHKSETCSSKVNLLSNLAHKGFSDWLFSML